MYKFIIVLILSISSIFAQSSLFINEIVSSNSVYLDEDNETPDWIELFNNSENTINLNNYSLSDDLNNPRKWIFPDISIGPNEFLVIFASGKDRYSSPLHTNFSIKSEGEILILSNSDEFLIDQVEPSEIIPDYSLGRNFINTSEWLFFPTPTPGKVNNTAGYDAISESPNFSVNGGFYSNSVLLALTLSSELGAIYYTTDGSEPTTNSALYTVPIAINLTTVIKAKTFLDGFLPSKTITNTFLINENISLPVVSLSTDPDNFFDDEIGIYVEGTGETPNYYQDWERPLHVELYESNGDLGFSIDAGVTIHGGSTREFSQKSLAIIARGKYGSSTIPYQLFPELPFNEYSSFLLRMSGDDNLRTQFRDCMMQSLVYNLNLETQAYRPSVVFLNGEYWGVYNIRERVNEDYITQYHNVDPNNLDYLTLDNVVLEGDNLHYMALYDYLQNNTLISDANYDYVTTQIDIENYINYMLAEMYFANTDWYPGNMKFWRPKTIDGKWRWILYDTDFGFNCISSVDNVDKNMINYVANTGRFPSFLFNALILNENFKKKFINTFADFANSIFQTSIVLSKIEEIKTLKESEMLRQFQRWGSSWMTANGLAYWYEQIDILKYFANHRIDNMKQHFLSNFFLSGSAQINLTLNNSDYGTIKINTIYMKTNIWSGDYFQGVPILLEAIAKPGYQFVGWEGDIVSTDMIINYSPNATNNIQAIFEPIAQIELPHIVINEINFKSIKGASTEDWIEIFNNGEIEVDLSNWIFKDDDDQHQFEIPVGISLEPGSFLVLCDDLEKFHTIFPNTINAIGNLGFGFSSDGELLRLFNNNGTLIDFVFYGIDTPWPSSPDGGGPTLELLHPDLDNEFAENWSASLTNYGTPGQENSVLQNKIQINVNIFLEGAYLNSNQMNNFAFLNSEFPLTQPFNIDQFNYQGSESISSLPNEDITDWVLVEIRADIEKESMIRQKAALLKVMVILLIWMVRVI